MTRQVLVTGVGGFVGGHLLAALTTNTDWPVRSQSRSAAPAVSRAIQHHRLDLANASDAQLDTLLKDVELCYHVAGMAHHAALQDPDGARLRDFNVALTERLYRAACRAGAARFVWLSSSKVLGDDSPAALPVTAPYAPNGHYATSKMEGEQGLLAAQQPETAQLIVRPPLIYGPGVGANFLRLLQGALSRWPLPLGRARQPRSFIGTDNLCAALLQCAQAPAGTYHVSDAEPLCVAELIRMIQALGGSGGPLIALSPGLIRTALRWTGRGALFDSLFAPLVLDTADSEARLQWRPTVATALQLEETLSWYRSLP